MPDKDPYSVLNLSPGASAEDIRRAYRRLALLYHPDLNPGDENVKERFRRVQEAYRTLRGRREGVPYRAGTMTVSGERTRTSPLLAGLRYDSRRGESADGSENKENNVDFYRPTDREMDEMSVADLLIRLENDRNHFVRAAAMQALSRRNSPEAVRALVSCSRNGPSPLRRFALDCLNRSIRMLGLRIVSSVWESSTIFEKYQLLLSLEELRAAIPPDFLDSSTSRMPRFLKARLERLSQAGRHEETD
jgi:hypothetical protein